MFIFLNFYSKCKERFAPWLKQQRARTFIDKVGIQKLKRQFEDIIRFLAQIAVDVGGVAFNVTLFYLDRDFVGQAVLRLSVAVLNFPALLVSFLRLPANAQCCVPR